MLQVCGGAISGVSLVREGAEAFKLRRDAPEAVFRNDGGFSTGPWDIASNVREVLRVLRL